LEPNEELKNETVETDEIHVEDLEKVVGGGVGYGTDQGSENS
jgi:hypothetical protein